MAKNKDRRHPKKPTEAPAIKTPLFKPRQDLIARIMSYTTDHKYSPFYMMRDFWFTAEEISNKTHEKIDQVRDCLESMEYKGELVRDGQAWKRVQKVPKDVVEVRPHVDPDLVLRVKKVLIKFSTVRVEDLKGDYKEMSSVMDAICGSGWATRLDDGSYYAVGAPVYGISRVGYSISRPRRKGNGKCLWCNASARRHARSEVHDIAECRLRMISNIMSD